MTTYKMFHDPTDRYPVTMTMHVKDTITKVDFSEPIKIDGRPSSVGVSFPDQDSAEEWINNHYLKHSPRLPFIYSNFYTFKSFAKKSHPMGLYQTKSKWAHDLMMTLAALSYSVPFQESRETRREDIYNCLIWIAANFHMKNIARMWDGEFEDELQTHCRQITNEFGFDIDKYFDIATEGALTKEEGS